MVRYRRFTWFNHVRNFNVLTIVFLITSIVSLAILIASIPRYAPDPSREGRIIVASSVGFIFSMIMGILTIILNAEFKHSHYRVIHLPIVMAESIITMKLHERGIKYDIFRNPPIDNIRSQVKGQIIIKTPAFKIMISEFSGEPYKWIYVSSYKGTKEEHEKLLGMIDSILY